VTCRHFITAPLAGLITEALSYLPFCSSKGCLGSVGWNGSVSFGRCWRPARRHSDTAAIAGSIALGFLANASFIVGVRGYEGTHTNALFFKLHALVVVSHWLGWFAKLLAVALLPS